MGISVHISGLLYDHDCVILPGLGGFVSNSSPASINRSTHTFYPPHKNIIFNKNLLNNDGLLVHKIATDQSISYADANNLLTDFIQNCKLSLKQFRRIELDSIGVLYLDKEDNIQFIQDKNINYSFDAFGLPVFKFKPLEQEHFGEKSSDDKENESPFKDRKPIEQSKKRSSIKRYAPALALIPIAAMLMWLPYKMKNADSSLNTAGWGFTNEAPIVESNYKPSKNPILSIYNELSKSMNEQLIASIDSVHKAILFRKVAETKVDSTRVENNNDIAILSQKSFHVMAGCFAQRANAERLVEILKAKGFSEAGIIGETHSGLIRVAFSSHTSREDATMAMNKAREITSSVWILNK